MAPDTKVPSVGPVPARIMVVGDAPFTPDEIREKKPFIGAGGELLRGALAKVGVNPEQVFYTNLCKYRPAGNNIRTLFDSNGYPTGRAVEGLAELKDEIALVNPNIIIAAGSYPLKFLTGKGTWKNDETGYSGIGTYRGSILEGSAFTGSRKVLPTYHPSAALRNYSWKHIIQADLARAAEQQHFPEIRRPRKHIVVDPRGPERDLWIAWLAGPAGRTPGDYGLLGDGESAWWRDCKSGEFLSGDIEYIGSKLLCFGATRHADVAVVFATRDARDLDDVRTILLSGVPLCFQNAMFDCSILEYHYGIPCLKHLKHDTMIAMHCAYTEFPKDLGFIASLFTEQPVWFEATGAAFWKATAKALGTPTLAEKEAVYLPYNGIDVWVTHSAMEQLLADELTDPDVRRSYEHEMALVRPLWEIGKRGVRIDTESLGALRSTLETESDLMLQGMTLLNGGEPVNPKSGPQVAKFLYERMGIKKIGSKTAKGAWQMNDDNLALLMLKGCSDDRQRTAIKLIREARERLDLISKFCEIELDDDGRMRCHYDPAKTETGRLSSRKFYPTGRGTNLQNVPKDTRVRSVFVPDKGKLFAYADLKSAESLVVAHITGDVEMLRLHSPEYMDGVRDGHKFVASFLLDKPIELITKDERYLGKRVRHAGNYGLGWYRLMQLVNGDAQKTGVAIDAALAKVLVNKYRLLHPGLKAWWDSVLAELWSTHTIYTCHRRKRVFYGRPDEVLPEAIAYNPQGTVAQTLNMGLLRLDKSYYQQENNWQAQWDAERYTMAECADMMQASHAVNEDGFEMLLQVHDAIGFQVPEANAENVLRVVQQLMAVPVQIRRRGVEPYTITIPVDIQVGWNWGEYDEKKNPLGLKAWKGD